MPRAFPLPTPRDYLLARDVCSYGYFVLAPNLWVPREATFYRVLTLSGRPTRIAVRQPAAAGRRAGSKAARGTDLEVTPERPLTKGEQRTAAAALTRMLRLDEDEAHVRAFHRVDPRWKRSGRGRVFRSPTFFEDVIKTVTSCNVTWPSTVNMNTRLCEVVGGGAFPTPEQLSKVRPQTLRVRCGVGYRDARIVELARMFARGEIDAGWFENAANPDEEVRERLLDLPGIGPYAAHNLMQLLGRYGHIPLDTESVRHGVTVLGMTGKPEAVMKRVHAHFEKFGSQRFRSYWFELWAYYETKAGPAPMWERETTAKAFTAAAFKKKEE